MPSGAAEHPEDPRNLKPAAENPWYVLATSYGEQTGDRWDQELHRKNRRIWNGWSCGHLPEDERAELTRSVGLDVAELAPWTEQERAAVEQLLAAKAMVLPDPEAEIRFDCLRFVEPLNLSGFVFCTPAKFNDSEFNANADLYAKFNHAVDFQSATFGGNANFSPNNFTGGVSFDSATFTKKLVFDQETFGGYVNLRSINFLGDVVFYHVNFGVRVNFSGAKFRGNAIFEAVGFRGGATFDSSEFDRRASFHDGAFTGTASFSNVKFGGITNFSGAYFEKIRFDQSVFHQETFFSSIPRFEAMRLTTFQNTALFHNVIFLSDVEFDDVHFLCDTFFSSSTFSRRASFRRAEFKSFASFIDCQFDRPATFHDAHFWTRFPMLSGAILHQNTAFTAKDEYWPEADYAPAEESRESLAIIRHVVGKQGLPEEEHYFFRREMAFAALIGSPLQRFPYWAFGVLSDYGNSLAKPVIGLGIVAYVGLVIYWNWLAWYAPDTLDFAGPFRTAAGFSVAQLFGFLGFSGSYFRADFLDALPTALKVIGGCQTVAGVVLLLFLGLGLRNRFRLK